MTERQTDPADSFWTWRETMYRFAARVGPESLHAIACPLYVEMLEAGYTSVCEFHYLHHAPDGTPYPDRLEMARALAQAAADTGIGLTLLPVLYERAGFTLEGRLRQHWFRPALGRCVDLMLYGILREEWAARQG